MKTLRKLLIIDDSEDDRELYGRFLRGDEAVSWQVAEVETGEAGLHRISREQFDCILLDYSLPSRHGLHILQEIAKDHPLTAIIMLTGQGNEVIATESLKAGACDYLVKNVITPEGLKRAVGNAVQKKTMLRKIAEQQAARDAFSKLMAHDLKEPLNVIRGMNALIREAYEAGDYDEIAYLCGRVDRASKRAQDLINTLRYYAQSTDDEIKNDFVDLTQAVSEATDNLQLYVAERQAQINCDILPTIHGSGPLLIQLFQNLIGNAVKYCEADIPVVNVRCSQTEAESIIAFEDNGIGIPEEYRNKVFEPSFRLHTHDEYSGSGIGLATCKNIVERHQGKIWCEDNQFGGTTICICFPRQEANAPPKSLVA